MVWHEDVRTIVMLTAEKEGGHVKAHNYWKSELYGHVNVVLLSENRPALDVQLPVQDSKFAADKAKNKDNIGPSTSKFFSLSSTSSASSASSDSSPEINDPDTPVVIIRKFTIAKTDEPFTRLREVTQLQYTNWPDFGALAKPAHLLDMVEQVNAAVDETGLATRNVEVEQKLSQSDDHLNRSSSAEETHVRPAVVHCSAGCGRTGTFCTVDTVIDALKQRRQLMQKPSKGKEKDTINEQDQERKMNLLSERERKRTPMEIDQRSSFPMFDVVAGRADKKDDRNVQNFDLLNREDVDLIEKTVEEFRNQRLSMVQCLRQYVFCYETVLEWFVRHVDF